MAEEIIEKVLSVFARVFEMEQSKLTLEMRRDDIEKWDSIGHLHLIMNLESELNIKFRMDEISPMQSIEDCTNIIKSYLK